MRRGTYFRIPEGPLDIDQLWREGLSFDSVRLPDWLAPEYANTYRYIGCGTEPNPGSPEWARYRAELAALEAAGLFVDSDPDDPHRHHLYLAVPDDDVWSIGIFGGESPLELASLRGAANPVLRREDIWDAPAIAVADPFMLRARGAWYMFFEILNWPMQKGEIGLAISVDGARWTYEGRVLVEPFHLSYPYVFEWRSEYYMIPESGQAGEVRLYQARAFPSQWSFVVTLLRGHGFADSSIFRHDNRWWLLTETSRPPAKYDTLRLYYADDLTGPWREHPKSPIVQGDATVARPGGRVLVLEDRVIRYAQNCRPRYGTDVRAFEITALTTTQYCECEARRDPILTASGMGWNAYGMHHIDAHRLENGQWIACVDGLSHPPSHHS